MIDSAKALKRIIRHVTAAVILHNLLIQDPIPEEWIDEDFLPLDDDDELNSQLPDDTEGNRLRQQLLAYLMTETGHH